MRHTHYLKRTIATDSVERLRFDPAHYIEAGFVPMQLGMPMLEAYQLVNKWNINQKIQRHVYALEQP